MTLLDLLIQQDNPREDTDNYIPLYINDYYPEEIESDKDDKESPRVIILEI